MKKTYKVELTDTELAHAANTLAGITFIEVTEDTEPRVNLDAVEPVVEIKEVVPAKYVDLIKAADALAESASSALKSNLLDAINKTS